MTVTDEISIRGYREEDIAGMTRIWNEVIEEGIAFPQEYFLDEASAPKFFASQNHCAVAIRNSSGEVCGLYTLHPNNVGRCGHIGNASYAVGSKLRGMHIGEKLVKDSLRQAKLCGFRVIQFNAVVESNAGARHLYEKLGFQKLGVIPEGFRMKDGHFENIHLYYFDLACL